MHPPIHTYSCTSVVCVYHIVFCNEKFAYFGHHFKHILFEILKHCNKFPETLGHTSKKNLYFTSATHYPHLRDAASEWGNSAFSYFLWIFGGLMQCALWHFAFMAEHWPRRESARKFCFSYSHVYASVDECVCVFNHNLHNILFRKRQANPLRVHLFYKLSDFHTDLLTLCVFYEVA